MAASGCRRPSLFLAGLAFGFQLTHGFVHIGTTVRALSPSSRPWLHRRVRSGAVSSMSAVSQVQQQGDGEALLSPAVSHEGDGDCAESEHIAEGDTITEKGQQAKRSRWPWRRSKKEERQGNKQENSEQSEGRGEVETREGLFTYDWDSGERIIWKASKRSRTEVVSQFGVTCCVAGWCFGGLVYRGTGNLVSHDHQWVCRLHRSTPPSYFPSFTPQRDPHTETGRVLYKVWSATRSSAYVCITTILEGLLPSVTFRSNPLHCQAGRKRGQVFPEHCVDKPAFPIQHSGQQSRYISRFSLEFV